MEKSTNHQQNQKEEEKRHAICLLAALGLRYTDVDVKGDKPDCVVSLPEGQKLAIELVEYHCHKGDNGLEGPAFEARWEKFDRMVWDRITKHPSSDTLRHTDRYISTRKRELPCMSRLPGFVDEFMQLLQSNLPQLATSQGIVLKDFSPYPLLADHLMEVELHHGAGVFQHGDCSEVQCGWSTLNGDVLTSLIESKGLKSTGYRAKLNGEPLWLLIHCGDHSASTFAPWSEDLASYCRENEPLLGSAGFDRIYFNPVRGDDGRPFLLYTQDG